MAGQIGPQSTVPLSSLSICVIQSAYIMCVTLYQVCEGLGSPQPQLAAAVFDVQHPVHVYGITANTGRLLHVFLGNGKTFRNCRVCLHPPPCDNC
jgi:hypothetical protein